MIYDTLRIHTFILNIYMYDRFKMLVNFERNVNVRIEIKAMCVRYNDTFIILYYTMRTNVFATHSNC